MQSKMNTSSRTSRLFPRLELQNTSAARKQNNFDRSFQSLPVNPTRRSGIEKVPLRRQTNRAHIAQHPGYKDGASQESSEGLFPQEMSQLTMSQGIFLENQEASSLVSGQSFSRVKSTGPPLHQNSSVSSASSCRPDGGGSRGSSSFYREYGFRRSHPSRNRKNAPILAGACNQLSAPRDARTIGFQQTKSAASVHSRMSSMAPSQLLLRMAPPRNANRTTSSHSAPRPRLPVPLFSTFSHASATSTSRLSAPVPRRHDTASVLGSASVQSSGPTTSPHDAENAHTRGTNSKREESMQYFRGELQLLLAAGLKKIEGGLDSQLQKVRVDNISAATNMKKQMDGQQSEIKEIIRAFNDRVGTVSEEWDERRQMLQDDVDAKQKAVDNGLRLLDDKLVESERAASSHIQRMEEVAEGRLEAISKSATTYVKKLCELTEASKDSIVKKCDDVIKAMLPAIQPPAKMIESLFKKSHDHHSTMEDAKKLRERDSLMSPPSPKTPTRSIGSIGEVKRERENARNESVSKKRLGAAMMDHVELSSQEVSLDRDATRGTKRIVRRRSSRVAKRGKRSTDGKENKTPSSKIQRPCVTPIGENPTQIGSPLLDTSLNGIASATKATAKVKSKGRSRKRIITTRRSSSSDKAPQRIPFEVITETSECPSPLGIQSVQVCDATVRPRQTKKRAVAILPTKGAQDKKSRTYGKRSLDTQSIRDDQFNFF